MVILAQENKMRDTLAVKKVKKYLFAFFMIILIFSITACSSQTDEFQTNVDSFVEHYKTATNTEDMLTEDINLKVAAGDLWKLSQVYQETDNRKALNDYLDKFISKDMFDEVYQYNKTNTKYSIEKDLIAYYQNK